MTRRTFALGPLAGALLLFAFPEPLRAAAVSGRVLDASGTPVAGAKVVWERHRSDETVLVDETRGVEPETLGETATDAAGRFRVSIDRPGLEVSIRIVPSSLPSALVTGPFDSTEEVALDDVQLPAAEKISGRVLDESGKPVAGAKVRGRSGPLGGASGVEFYAEATTAADGAFVLPHAPSDAFSLEARAAGLAPGLQTRFQRRGPEKLILRKGGNVAGAVLDVAGKPAEGAVVSAGLLATRTDASGAFRIAGVPPGSRAVEALWKEDFAARKDAVRVAAGATVEVPLRLAKAAAIGGTVVDEKTQRPVAGVRITLSTGGGLPFRDALEGPMRRGRTDAKGRFRVGGLASRRYSVAATKADYLPATMAGVAPSVSSPASLAIALQKAASVAGRVTDESGAGIAGARVRFAREQGLRALVRGGAAAFLERGGVTTGPDGTFRLRGLAAAKNKTLEATRAGHVSARRHGVTIKAGEAVKDVALVLRRGLEARGRVVDSAGQPIAGAEIRLTRPEGGAGRVFIQMAGANREKPDAASGADGAFRVAGLEPGEYSVTVSREGYATARVPSATVAPEGENEWAPVVLSKGAAIAGVVRNSKGEPVVSARIFSFGEGAGARDATTDTEGRFRIEGFGTDRPVMLNVSADGFGALQRRVTPPAEDLALVLKTSGAIRGRVEDAATNRPVTEFTASYSEARAGGLGGVRIMMGGGSNERAFESADGTFELPDVPAGKWTVSASAPGYRPSEVAGIEVGEGETKDGVVLVMRRGAVVSGRVLDLRRGAVPNASVAWSEGSGGGAMGMGAIARMAGDGNAVTTDAEGRFRFDGLPAGRLTFTAEHPDFLEVTRSVDVEDTATVDLTLETGGSIAGTVVGKDGRAGVPGALVALDGQGESFGIGDDSVRTDGSGNFSFEHLKPGRYRLTARSSSGSSAAQEVVLAESQSVTGVRIEMASGATIRGSVSGLPSGRTAGVRVFATARDYQDGTVTGDDGSFVLRDVPAGIVRLQATAAYPAMRTATKNVEVPEGSSELPVEIAFEGESRLAGRVTRGEKPLAGVFVMANPDPPSAGGRSSDQTDEDGRYAIEGLVDGNYNVSLSGPGVTYRRTIAVAGDTDGDIALPASGITGIVSESGSGDPIEGASVQAETGRERTGFPARYATTDSRGLYSIEDLDAGDYRVTARKEGYQLRTLPVSVGSAPAELNVSLSRGSGLSIRAADGLTGTPLGSLTVLAYADSGVLAYTGGVSLDSEGRGEIASLAPGRYSIYVFSGGYASRSFPSVAVPSAPLEIPMTPGGRVEVRTDSPFTGRLLDAAGAPYLFFPGRADARVNGSPPATSFDRVAPGAYRLVIAGESGERSFPFTVAEGRTTTVEIR